MPSPLESDGILETEDATSGTEDKTSANENATSGAEDITSANENATSAGEDVTPATGDATAAFSKPSPTLVLTVNGATEENKEEICTAIATATNASSYDHCELGSNSERELQVAQQTYLLGKARRIEFLTVGLVNPDESKIAEATDSSNTFIQAISLPNGVEVESVTSTTLIFQTFHKITF